MMLRSILFRTFNGRTSLDVMILSESLRETDNHNTGVSIALLPGAAYAASDKKDIIICVFSPADLCRDRRGENLSVLWRENRSRENR